MKWEELGLELFRPDTKKAGKYFGEILPISFDSDCPYFEEVPVHEMVGIMNASYICMLKFKNGKCFRCTKQKQMYNLSKGETTNEIKALFPRDKVVYFFWDRTEELGSDKSPEYKIKVWVAPKIGVHAELQKEVRDKKTKQILDISDLSEDGEGRTVYFEIEIKTVVNEKTKQKQTFPSYTSFDLLERDEPIPDEILEKLTEIIEKITKIAKENGYSNPIDSLFYYPEDNELEEVMQTEVHTGDDKESEEQSTTGKKSKLQEIRDKKAQKQTKEETNQVDIDELEKELSEMNTFKLKKWIKENNLEDLMDSSLSKDEQIIAILEYFDQLNSEADDMPF
jgi:hypothetical protein